MMYDIANKELLRIGVREGDLPGPGAKKSCELRIDMDGSVWGSHVHVSIQSSDFTVEHEGGRSVATVVYHPNLQELYNIKAAIEVALHEKTGSPKKKRIATKKKKARSGK